MDAAIHDDQWGPSKIYTLSQQYGDKVLPCLERYLTDPSTNVRSTVEATAAHYKTPEARKILFALVADEPVFAFKDDIAEEAIDALARQYRGPDLRRFGGGKFFGDLLKHVMTYHGDGTAILLLTETPDKKGVVSALQRLRQSHGTGGVSLGPAPVADRAVVIDAALTELGDGDAGARMARVITSGTVPEVEALLACYTTNYIHNPRLLSEGVELLKDKRETSIVRGGIGYAAKAGHYIPTAFYRVCDGALTALASTNHVDVGFDLEIINTRPFTDAELAVGYERLKRHFG